MTFDSNTFAGSSNWQTQTPQSTFNFNFGTKIYYLDAELSRSTNNESSWLGGIQIYRN